MKNKWLSKSEEYPDVYMGVHKVKIKKWIMLMLGSPVIKLEFDDEQLNLVVDEAAARIEAWGIHEYLEEDALYETVLKDGSLALAKEMLGRIRNMYPTQNSRELLEEGHEDFENWMRWLDHLATEVYDYDLEEDE